MQAGELKEVKFWLVVFVVALLISGLTAFPLIWEIKLLSQFLHSISWSPNALTLWIERVEHGLLETDANYPFIAYGTDWLAFGHIAIAIFLIPVIKDPIKHIDIIKMGQIVCLLVIPMALICGAIRQIPFFWILIDSSFGIFGYLLLSYILKLIYKFNRIG